MNLAELQSLIDDARAAGADDDTPVMLATQPNYPLKSAIAGLAVVPDAPEGWDDELNSQDDPYMVAQSAGIFDTKPAAVLLAEGKQYFDPYLDTIESVALANALPGTDWDRD